MWYAKMYFSEGREIFQYDSLGMQGVPDVQKEFPFLESLLSFQELDCKASRITGAGLSQRMTGTHLRMSGENWGG